MPPKSKKNTATAAAEEPAAKKAKAEAKSEAAPKEVKPPKKEEPKKEEPKKEEPKKEELKKEEPIEIKEEGKFQEPDAPKDNRAAFKGTVAFAVEDTTLNVIQTMGGKLITGLTEGGMAYLVAGARASVAQKSGRYMFEVKIVQQMDEKWGYQLSRPMLKVGFSSASSSLFVGEDGQGVAFDSDGNYQSGKTRTFLSAKARMARDTVIALVLNLDAKSPNCNTVALYQDGAAVSEPKPLPEELHGKPLFPHIAFRNVTLQVNFGPTALKDLPFKCRMLQGAANSDVVAAASKEPKDGKYNVILPMCVPDEGGFDWLDSFLEKNPGYLEISDRKILDWAKSSGLFSKPGGWNNSNDKPVFNFGVPSLDDHSVRRVLAAMAPATPRNYVVMEVRSNLIEDDRKDILRRFNYPCFKKTAHVVMGEPSKDFKKIVHDKLLKDKQDKSDAVWKKLREETKRKKELTKQLQAKKTKKDGVEEIDDEDEKVEDDETPPTVELTDKEKALVFMPKSMPDLSPQTLNASLGKFSVPQMDEGFDDIQFEWAEDEKAAEYLKNWDTHKKLTTRIEDLKPGQGFKDKMTAFDKKYAEWLEKDKTLKKPAKKLEEDELDIFSVTDIMDGGDGQPLFSKFDWQDWELLKLRVELCTMTMCFKEDSGDAARVGIPFDHLSFYYNKYFGKSLNYRMYGVNDSTELIAMIKDTVVNKNSLLVPQLSDDAHSEDIFVKLTEEGRRERQRRIDAGDESARLKFQKPVTFVPVEKKAAPKVESKPAWVEPKKQPKVVAPKAKAAPKVETTSEWEPAPQPGQYTTPGPQWGKESEPQWGKEPNSQWGGEQSTQWNKPSNDQWGKKDNTQWGNQSGNQSNQQWGQESKQQWGNQTKANDYGNAKDYGSGGGSKDYGSGGSGAGWGDGGWGSGGGSNEWPIEP